MTRKISVLAHTLFLLYMLLLFWIIALKCNMTITISDTKIMNAGTTLLERFNTYLSYKVFFVDWTDTLVNIVLFLPLGMIMPFLFKKNPHVKAIACGLMISVAFEIFQIISCIGMFTYADIIYNTAGALLGSVLHLCLIRSAKDKSLETTFVIHILILIPVLIYAAINTVNNIHLYL